jgi:integrase
MVVREEHLPEKVHPGEHLKRPRAPKPELEILNPDEVDALLEALEEKRSHYRVASLTDILTGLRAGELWALSWSDIYWHGKQSGAAWELWCTRSNGFRSELQVRITTANN